MERRGDISGRTGGGRLPVFPVLFSEHGQRCARCGTFVDDDEAASCPECGASLAPGCVGCGYDLGGLARELVCPECGTAVALAYAPDLLRYRSPASLRRVARGLSLVLSGVLVWFFLLVLTLLLVFGAAWVGPGLDRTLHSTASLGRVGASLMMVCGWWNATAPEPARIATALDARPRRLIRSMVVIHAGVCLLPFLLRALPLLSPGSATAVSRALMATWLVGGIAWVVQFFAAMLYVSWMADRVPDALLAAHADRFLWIGPVLFVAFFLCFGLGPVIALVLYWLILRRLRRGVRGALAEAQRAEAAGVGSDADLAVARKLM